MAGFVVGAEELIKYCREHMAHFKAPKTIVFRELPKTATGKIQKHELKMLVKPSGRPTS